MVPPPAIDLRAKHGTGMHMILSPGTSWVHTSGKQLWRQKEEEPTKAELCKAGSIVGTAFEI